MNTKKEKELPAAADVAAIAHLRAVTTAGASVNATPAQLREMVGIDYSSLEEQEVPGEKWLGTDGVKRQVYVRTFRGDITNLAISGSIALTTGIYSATAVMGYIEFTHQGAVLRMPLGIRAYDHNFTVDSRNNDALKLFNFDFVKGAYTNITYNLTLKYAKV